MQNLFHCLAFALLATCGVLLCAVQPFPMLHDYPEWMYQGWLIAQLWAGTAIESGYQLARWPVPNSFSQFVLAGLNQVVSPVAAGKLWLATYLIFCFATFYTLSRRCWPDRAGYVNLALTCTIALGPGFWNGYINNQLGLVMLACWLLLRDQLSKARQQWLLLVFSVLLFFTHATVFIGFGLIVGVGVFVDWHHDRRRAGWTLLAMLPSTLLGAWYATVKLGTGSSAGESGLSGLSQVAQYKFYTITKQGSFHHLLSSKGSGVMESYPVIYYAGFAINLVIVGVIGVWLLRLVYNVVRRQSVTSALCSRTIGFVGALLVLLGLAVLFLVPGQKTLGVVNLGERFFIMAVLLALIWCVCDKWLLASWSFLCVVGMLVTIASLGTIAAQDKSLATAMRDGRVEKPMVVNDSYNTRYNFFNHRLTIYAGRGQFLLSGRDPSNLPVPEETLATGPLILE